MQELIAELEAMQERVWRESFKDYCEAMTCQLGLCEVAMQADPEQGRKIMQERQAPWAARNRLLSRLQVTIDSLKRHEERRLG